MALNLSRILSPSTLLRSLLGPHECYITKLSIELFTEEIFPEFTIEDLLSLRMTGRFFYRITHAPIIWRRYLERMHFPLPPMRPTFDYNLAITDYEIERLVARGLSVDYNWRHPKTTAMGLGSVYTIHHMCDLALVPGSRFLLASTKEPLEETYYLELFSLDNLTRSRMLCMLELPAKAFNMKAKYMTYDGEYGIVTLIQTRNFPPDIVYKNFNPNVYSADANIEAPGPLLHEITCFFTPLRIAESCIRTDGERTGPDAILKSFTEVPNPFIEIGHLQSADQFKSPMLLEINDTPFAVAVVQPKTILMCNLETNVVTTVIMTEYLQWSSEQTIIHAVYPIPGRRTIAVLRTLKNNTLPGVEGDYHCVESIHLPKNYEEGTEIPVVTDVRLQFREIPSKAQEVKLSFSEPEVWPRLPDDLPDQLYDREEDHELAPISIFGTAKQPGAFYHWNIWPSCTIGEDGAPIYAFTTFDHHITPQSLRMVKNRTPFVLPGTSRSLIFMLDPFSRKPFPPPMEMYRYINPEAFPDTDGYEWPPPGTDGQDTKIMRRPRPSLPMKRFAKIAMPEELNNCLTKFGDLAALSWDGHIGRLCFATEKSTYLRVLDFGTCSKPEELLWKWVAADVDGKVKGDEMGKEKIDEGKEEESDEESMGGDFDEDDVWV